MGMLNKAASVGRTGLLVANPSYWKTVFVAVKSRALQTEAVCPICDFRGRFDAAGVMEAQMNARCPKCRSLQRHRLLALALQRDVFSFARKRVLHFAPEKPVTDLIARQNPTSYLTTDLDASRAMVALNIERLAVDDASYDVVVCSHVLEHVDDAAALCELYRILGRGGIAVLLFPIVEGWEKTYEDDTKLVTPEGRMAHFGQDDHVRFYGSDVRNRIQNAGFVLEEFTAGGEDSATYALIRGEKLFLARKP